jgi:hypothetical protein
VVAAVVPAKVAAVKPASLSAVVAAAADEIAQKVSPTAIPGPTCTPGNVFFAYSSVERQQAAAIATPILTGAPNSLQQPSRCSSGEGLQAKTLLLHILADQSFIRSFPTSGCLLSDRNQTVPKLTKYDEQLEREMPNSYTVGTSSNLQVASEETSYRLIPHLDPSQIPLSNSFLHYAIAPFAPCLAVSAMS